MNENDQVVHYMDNSYSYPVSEGYVDYYSGASTAPLNYLNFAPMHDQESIYWSMHMNSYKYGQPNPEGFYYGLYDDNDLPPRMDSNRRVWEYSSMATTEDPITVDIPPEQSVVSEVHSIPEESVVSEVHSIPEERLPNDQDAANDEVAWQDDINPDTMTYEELLDLGEAVGTQNRGLSQELIDLLPTSKHKSGGIFSRKKSEESFSSVLNSKVFMVSCGRTRCVICQMRYKRGDRQINLPCKHAYHTHCGSKWLSINKIHFFPDMSSMQHCGIW
ncbi:E3 ubiquitin-protein ligase BIG BROTHER-like isoform X2 [Salvia splendens]|uniref:E3 ubiquitin-protein ligase BIG BROTHER-like isoform X2 n=1 Tax=Salvia splendens TaxID=180675 RepID=UPI001C26B78D|nr:E3 ubiquitin-protein ligase BIG BROTHER-like isoform X2 [Salvia splendens]